MKVVWLDTPPPPPERFPNPFDEAEPHPLARHCAELVMEELRSGTIAPGISTALLRNGQPGSLGGKMFGVLAFHTPEGRIGFIRAISGQLGRAWLVQGHAPPLFDVNLRNAVEPQAEVLVKDLTSRVDVARTAPALLELHAALQELERRHTTQRDELRASHLANRKTRREERAAIKDPTRQRELDQLSRADDAQRRALEADHRKQRSELVARLTPLERHLTAVERLRRLVSREAMRRIWDTYSVTNFRGETKPLRSLFPGDPPSGAADCAAPRLLHAARARGWKPLALAEFWWGDPPPGGSRREGACYPACREKCGPILPFMMEGLEVAPRHVFRPPHVASGLHVVHLDERFLIIDKPPGLLSVPAKDERIEDSVVARIRAQFPAATGPLAVHRLDLDTSGLLLVALDEETQALLQRQFLSRAIEKTYVAVLEGAVEGEEGIIDLPLRVDLEQRPRQLVDPEHGRSAQTKWKVVSRAPDSTRMHFRPLTGRTHQLRVHAAQGLRCPIVGDRLYGTGGPRLLLHATELRLANPFTGAPLHVVSPCPF